MDKKLEKMKGRFIEHMETMDSVLGAWDFGSETHNLSDDFSDVDIVLLIEGKQFAQFTPSLEECLGSISDEIILCWPEQFNSDSIINNGYLLSSDSHIFQFDVFLLNSEKLDDYMCRLHYTGLKESDIIFDKVGAVRRLAELKLSGNLWEDDISYLEKTYWYHANMTGKYLKRKDFFKLNNVLRTMFETHVSMLLVGFDKITWGGSANKLHFIPEEKQAHLKRYYCSENFEEVERNLIYCMREFQSDTKGVYELKGLAYKVYSGNMVIDNWVKEME
ncbi:MAG: aminoglycoside 6-adenylyltransferase [Acetatifactor sp.]|nr:aminoglycoside 6-adenylyltransferase [Acetatifactor sp.]